jgi:putative MATE family efflux protein
VRPESGGLDRRIIALALPALGALLVEPIYNLTDSAIVGHLGPHPLAALALAGGALTIMGWTAGFLEMATVSMVAHRRGAGDSDGAARAVGAAYLVSVGLGLLASGVLALVAPVLVDVLGGRGTVASEAVTYLRISAVGLVPLLVSLAGNGHFVGMKDTRTPLLVALVANGANVALEVVLVYVEHLGIAGSAWGTVAAQVLSAALFLVASRRSDLPPARPGNTELWRLAGDGLRLTVRTAALGLALLASTAIAARVGTIVLAGHQIALQVWTLLALSLDSLAVPAQVFVGEALGRGDARYAREVGRRTLRLGLIAGIAAGAFVVGLAWVLPAVFSPDVRVEHQATTALIVCGALQPAAALAFVFDGLLLGASRYRTLQRAMIVALLAFAPFAVATAVDHRLGIVGVWLALMCWLSARAALLAWRWHTGDWADGPGMRSMV